MEGSLGYMLKLFQSKIPSLNYSGTTFFRKTAKFRRFFLGKLLELLTINHSSSGRRDIFVLWLLKIFHALVILHFAWVHTCPELSWKTRSDSATISRCQASCDMGPNGPARSFVSFNIRQVLKFQHVSSTLTLIM